MIVPKKSLQDMKPYFSNSQKFKLKLDANECKNYLLDEKSLEEFFKTVLLEEEFNIYPDSDALKLKLALAQYYNVNSENLILGNGSSEMIHLLFSTYCEKNDIILTFSPNFSMYDVYSRICEAKLEKINTFTASSKLGFVQDIALLIERAHDLNPKIILLCNPNNPTGSIISISDIEKIALSFPDTLVAVDEAYADFANVSAINLISKYNNIVVLRTLSKAFGLADIRTGMIIADEKIILQLQISKAPYNLNGISQKLAIYALENKERVSKYISEVNTERESLSQFLQAKIKQYDLEETFKIYPSNTNFIFLKSENLNLVQKLAEKSIAIRDFSSDIKAHYRISIGDQAENKILKQALSNIFEKYCKCKETQNE